VPSSVGIRRSYPGMPQSRATIHPSAPALATFFSADSFVSYVIALRHSRQIATESSHPWKPLLIMSIPYVLRCIGLVGLRERGRAVFENYCFSIPRVEEIGHQLWLIIIAIALIVFIVRIVVVVIVIHIHKCSMRPFVDERLEIFENLGAELSATHEWAQG